MSKQNKILMSVLGAGMMIAAGSAHAADETVLFKIHNIEPVKNSDGQVTSCDLGATFYNRSAAEVKNASLNLIWLDEVVDETINQEERAAKEARRTQSEDVARYNTASYTSKDVVLKLRLPPLKPHQQVTLKSKVATDRCFMLLNDMDIEVLNCSLISPSKEESVQVQSSCQDLFTYISPKNAQYYNDFKSISEEEALEEEKAIIKSKKDDLNSSYEDALEQLENIGKTLDVALK